MLGEKFSAKSLLGRNGSSKDLPIGKSQKLTFQIDLIAYHMIHTIIWIYGVDPKLKGKRSEILCAACVGSPF